MKTTFTKEQLAEILDQAVEEDLQRYNEEFRLEQMAIYKARLKKEAEGAKNGEGRTKRPIPPVHS